MVDPTGTEHTSHTELQKEFEYLNQQNQPAKQRWTYFLEKIYPRYSDFETAFKAFQTVYPDFMSQPAPVWFPGEAEKKHSNLARVMSKLGFSSYKELHQYSIHQREDFWQQTLHTLNIKTQNSWNKVITPTDQPDQVIWLKDAKLNIAASCFQQNPEKIAIYSQTETGPIQTMSYGELDRWSNRIAQSLISAGFKQGDVIGIAMPMHAMAIAIYLGIIKAGCIVCAIAESFASAEIEMRLRITQAKAVFTQDYFIRAGKALPLYEKVLAAHSTYNIVIGAKQIKPDIQLAGPDRSFDEFLTEEFLLEPILRAPNDAMTYLFSSGTTGEPKAIPWSHTTPIKCAADAFYHLNFTPNDIYIWPTSLGWMMGPFLVFACLINGGAMALFEGSPASPEFAQFVEQAKVTHVGVVPSLVKAWRNNKTAESYNWHQVKLFSSTGECSNVEDMFYLSWLGGFKPVIEYCGGTEIGGAYISSTVLDAFAPATFTGPTLGLDLVLLDEQGQLAEQQGEVALVPPSIGLSLTLLNRDHHKVYFENMPQFTNYPLLRRHGDEIQKLDSLYYRALGRSDDTMNLGGIKISSAEIERTLNLLDIYKETAAVALNPPGGGPSLLVIFYVPHVQSPTDEALIKSQMQDMIREKLNPLFRIHKIIRIDELPRTASNKVMRRVLRDRIEA